MITLKSETAERLGQGMSVGSAIELPFFAPVFWTINGDARMKAVGGAQSQITPIGAYVPKEITQELMEHLFVGEDIAETMMVYLEGAQDWLHAYDAKVPNSGQPANGNGGNGHDGFYPDPVPPLPDDDILF
jgi:hypothetical protein